MFSSIKKSLKSKIIVLSALILLIISAAIIIISANNLRKIAKESALHQATVEGEKFTVSFKTTIEEALLLVRNLSDIYATVSSHSNPIKISRAESDKIVNELIERNKNIYGIYVSWVPDNSFDGLDPQYAGKPGQTPSGRYTVYYVRFGDYIKKIIEREQENEWEEEQSSDYFAKPRDKGIECIIDPYLYPVEGDTILMISLTAPILNNNRFYGIAGVDIKVDFIQKIADEIDLFEKTGKISIIANNGTLVGGTGLKKYDGQPIDSIPNFSGIENLLQKVQQGIELDTTNSEMIEILLPIKFGKTDTPWAALVQVPLEVPMRAANSMIWTQTIISIILVIAGIMLIYWFMTRTTKPIMKLVEIANNIKKGQLDNRIEIQSEDEIGVLAGAFDDMSRKIKEIISEINKLGTMLDEGKLDWRARGESFEGSFAELIGNINQAINNIVKPLNVTAEYIDRISKGDIPPKIVEEYKGDFNEIKNNINQCIDAINLLIKDTYGLVDKATEGRLNERADASRHQGDFRRLVEGINATLDRLVGLIDNMPLPVQIVDGKNNVIYSNKKSLN